MDRFSGKLKSLIYCFVIVFSLFIPGESDASDRYYKIQKRVEPFLLPRNSPAKAILDQIFSRQAVLLNEKNLKKAGFRASAPRKFTRLIVATHVRMPGYIFKIYLDNQRYYKIPEYEQWIQRIQGATLIQQQLNIHHWNHLFKVPRKWVYLLPKESKCPKDFVKKYTILVEEDMDLLENRKNKACWQSDDVSEELLSALYFLVDHLGLRDCLKPDNIPFSRDGKVAFIDTPTYGETVDFSHLNSWLSRSNGRFWKLLQNGM